MNIELDNRKQIILRAVVQSFVFTGKPVGSKAIAETYDLGVSTATIRNEMGVLEHMGLLVQPHTSAGRVPTDMAYRYYVDMLMGQAVPTGGDAEEVQRLFSSGGSEVEGLMREASILLSRLTHTAAMVFAPFVPASTVRRLDMVRLSDTRAMVIVITDGGEVGRRHLSLGHPVSGDTVERVLRYLNANLSGKRLEEIDQAGLLRRARFGAAGSELLQAAVTSTCEYLGAIEDLVFIGGTSNIAREMESSGQEWVQTLLDALERQYFILELLKDIIGENQLTVRIGEENRLTELQRCALVGSSYSLGHGVFGSLGVVGPTSIDYARTIGMVRYMAENLGRILQTPAD